MRIAVDLSYVNQTKNGTHLFATEFLRALLQTRPEDVDVTIIFANENSQIEHHIEIDSTHIIYLDSADIENIPVFDLIHRPVQIGTQADIELLLCLGVKQVVTYLDLIAFADYRYFPNLDSWNLYRLANQLSFSTIDGVLYISDFVQRDAHLRGLLLPSEREVVTYCGTDHISPVVDREKEAEFYLPNSPFLLVLGANFIHKNRDYALSLFFCLAEHYNWQGEIIFAGPEVHDGSSLVKEWLVYRQKRSLQKRVYFLGNIEERYKKYLLSHAELLLYPSTHEGFGLVPFEAASLGTPSLSFRFGALQEVCGNEILYLEDLNPAHGAETVWAMLSTPSLRKAQVDRLKTRGKLFTWNNMAQRTWKFYFDIISLPKRDNFITLETTSLDKRVDAINAISKQYRRSRMPRIKVWKQRTKNVMQIGKNFGIRLAIQHVFLFLLYHIAKRRMTKY